MEELWEPVANFEDYVVSNSGKVFSIKSNLELRPLTMRDGYKAVRLFKNGRAKSMQVHRLVASAFIDNPLNKPQVNHKDGDKQNNYFLNLEWNTASENQIHAINLGLVKHHRGQSHFKCKLTKYEDEIVDYLYCNFNISIIELAKIFKVSKSAIRRSLHRKLNLIGENKNENI